VTCRLGAQRDPSATSSSLPAPGANQLSAGFATDTTTAPDMERVVGQRGRVTAGGSVRFYPLKNRFRRPVTLR
jgi:hypothetical protein